MEQSGRCWAVVGWMNDFEAPVLTVTSVLPLDHDDPEMRVEWWWLRWRN